MTESEASELYDGLDSIARCVPGFDFYIHPEPGRKMTIVVAPEAVPQHQVSQLREAVQAEIQKRLPRLSGPFGVSIVSRRGHGRVQLCALST